MFWKTILGSILTCTIQSTAFANALNVAPGSWGFDPDSANREASETLGCNSDPLIISISDDGKRYSAYREDNIDYYEADILAHGEKHLVIRYDGEKRMMGENETQIWTLLLVEKDMFVWIMGQPGDFRSHPSDPRYRCKLGVS